MPTFTIIDRGPDGEMSLSHMDVQNRAAARSVLAYDLQTTADREWGADILQAFDSGENVIIRPNGPNGDEVEFRYTE